jgi:hypothetical protein
VPISVKVAKRHKKNAEIQRLVAKRRIKKTLNFSALIFFRAVGYNFRIFLNGKVKKIYKPVMGIVSNKCTIDK